MKVLVACEFSGKVRDAFIRRGHDAISCDLLPTDSPGPHYQGNVLDIIHQGFDLMIAHPPCTYLANSGVQWLHRSKKRWKLLFEAADFFVELLSADIEKIVIENPIPHRYAMDIIKVNHSQVIQPWMFGHPEKKATCLWLKNVPELQPTNNVKAYMNTLSAKEQQKSQFRPDSKGRSKLRSTTYQGIADALADQLG
jgi:hypothetical protein